MNMVRFLIYLFCDLSVNRKIREGVKHIFSLYTISPTLSLSYPQFATFLNFALLVDLYGTKNQELSKTKIVF